MKKLLLLAATALISGSTFAQTVADRDQWTCSGTHENLYTQLNAGMTVLIAMQGLDCSGCIGNAPHVDSFATNNKGKVRVWSALQLMAGSGGTCTQVQSWIQTNGYNDVFTFLDSSAYWSSTYPGTEWIVIDPADKKIKYQGLSRTTAFAEARKIFAPTSVGEVSAASGINIYPNPAQDYITIELTQQDASVSLYSIDGRVVHTAQYNKGKHTIDIATIANGMYVLDITTDKGRHQTRIVKN